MEISGDIAKMEKIEIAIRKGKTIACGEYGNQKIKKSKKRSRGEVKASEFRVIPEIPNEK